MNQLQRQWVVTAIHNERCRTAGILPAQDLTGLGKLLEDSDRNGPEEDTELLQEAHEYGISMPDGFPRLYVVEQFELSIASYHAQARTPELAIATVEAGQGQRQDDAGDTHVSIAEKYRGYLPGIPRGVGKGIRSVHTLPTARAKAEYQTILVRAFWFDEGAFWGVSATGYKDDLDLEFEEGTSIETDPNVFNNKKEDEKGVVEQLSDLADLFEAQAENVFIHINGNETCRWPTGGWCIKLRDGQ